MAFNVLDITADLVDLTGDEQEVTTVVRELEGVDMTLATTAPVPKKAKATKPKTGFTCVVCWCDRQKKSRSKIKCGHDLCRKCEKRMVNKCLYDCPICRSKDAVLNAFVGLESN